MRLIDVMLYSEATNLSTTPAVAYALIGINCVVAVVTKRVDTVSVVVNAGILRLNQHSISPTYGIGNRTRRNVAEDFGSGHDGRNRRCRRTSAEDAIGGGSEHHGKQRLGWLTDWIN
jgi:hypothetical protein